MNELQHILHSLNNEKASHLCKAMVAFALALLLALTPGLAFATAGDESAPEATEVVAEVTEAPEDNAAGFEAESNQNDIDANTTISTATAEEPGAPEVGDEDPDPEAEMQAALRGIFYTYLEKQGVTAVTLKSPYEKARLAHDCLIEWEDAYFNPASSSTGVSGYMAAAANNKQGCSSQSFHDAFVFLLKITGIEDSDIEPVTMGDHVWTLVRLDGKWTHIDTAYDMYFVQTNKHINYLCFGLTDAQIRLLHPGYSGSKADSIVNNYYYNTHDGENLPLSYVTGQIARDKLVLKKPFLVSAPELDEAPVVNGVPFRQLMLSQMAVCLNGQKFCAENGLPGIKASVAYKEDADGFEVATVTDISAAFSGLTMESPVYTGSYLKPKLTAHRDYVLEEGTDYSVKYVLYGKEISPYPLNAGTYDVIITGMGSSWEGTITKQFTVRKKDISDTSEVAVVNGTFKSVVNYTGNPISQEATRLTYKGKQLTSNDYEDFKYENQKGPGQARLIIKGQGNFTGTREILFVINGTNQTPSNQTGSGSSNNGATNVTTQAVPTAKTVSGTWKKSGGKWWFSYDAKTTKAERKSWPANEWVIISGKRYHFDSRGYMNTNWFSYSGKWYFLGSDGAMKTGWQKSGGKWYYMASDGVMQTGKKSLSDGKTYYLNPSSGAMKTGWNKEGSTWYYYNSSGAMVAKNWVKSSGKWYYFGNNGAMQTSKQTIGNQTYNFASSGAMITGWNKENGTYYHYGSSGAMTKGWVKSGSKWYFMDRSTGAMWTKQLEKIDGKTYAFHPSTGEMLVGWFKLTHPTTKVANMYYFKSSGVMAAGEWVGNYYLESDGKMARNKWIGKYHVNSDGYWDATAK